MASLVRAGCLEQFGRFLACLEQARLHGVLRYADDLRRLRHGLLMAIREIDDLPMIRR